jgi:cysteine dioxygenase
MKTVKQFVDGLCRLPATDFDLDRIDAYLHENPVDVDSLAPYLFFEPTHYTRNLIYRCPQFELMAICWDVGQGSRIHNHAGQDCWMAVPIGRLAVQNYEVVKQDAKTGYCELREAHRVEMEPGRPTRVEREMPVHAVLNLPEYGERAASLHVYSKPYDRCLIYNLEQKSYCEVPLFFDSEFGKRLEKTTG